MSNMQLLSPETMPAYADIAINAYPTMDINTPEARQKLIDRLINIQQNIPVRHVYGLYRNEQAQGGMILYDFRMNMFGATIDAGGVGMVAVDLLHKKEHVAKELIAFFLEHYREAGATMALLYPFRPDFYYAMGFGYGTKLNEYRIRPSALPCRGSKEHLRVLTADDKEALAECYSRYQTRTHGMIVRHAPEWDTWFNKMENRVIGYVRDGKIEGYMLFGFKRRTDTSPLRNNLVVHELLYEHPQALETLLTFLHTQADQIDRIVITTHDETFHHLLTDPRDESEALIPSVYHECNVQGVGLMYRVIDIPKLFTALSEHNFNGQNCRLKLTVHDNFLPANDGSLLIDFEQGKVSLRSEGDFDVEISLNVAEFSSLIVGCVDFKSLYTYGLAQISNPAYLETVHRLFKVEEKPICLTAF